ncbi:hypothetical protein KGF54_002526 [Candida jiufengensis]|uniref:uncharacterized protein n=1 Tax=Candida jiufengensis TaxID=497108 RepID=UPI0022257718|nr:uncharacterized protein KGF54_002526 [Candida jiufengensis]KAI5953155.1 hypothetical protein KGF54_002526 [Candida jiufengensis]
MNQSRVDKKLEVHSNNNSARSQNVRPLALSSPIHHHLKKQQQLNHISKHYKYIQTPPLTQLKQASTIQVLPLIASSSSFDIDSPTSDPLTPISPRDFISPHDPPFQADLYFPPPKIRRSISILGGSSDIFTDYVEDRYSRFRPNVSQHNNDVIMNNLHPFQKDNYGLEQKNFLQNLNSWFKSKPVIAKPIDLERQDPIQTGGISNSNKSDSFRTIIINQEPEPTPQPIYTPKGIPINEYALNYDKLPDNSNLGEEIERRAAIVNSFDDDIRDLIDGVDNFLTSCFDGIWFFFSEIWQSCTE